MKNLVPFFISLMMISCGKKEDGKEVQIVENVAVPPYDTVAVDSFSNGAISVDIARKIRMSSVQYQDSLKEAVKKLEAEKLLQKEAEEKDKAAKILDAEKKKAEATKSNSEKTKVEAEKSSNPNSQNP